MRCTGHLRAITGLYGLARFLQRVCAFLISRVGSLGRAVRRSAHLWNCTAIRGLFGCSD